MKEALRYKLLTDYARDSVLKLSRFYNSEEQGSEQSPSLAGHRFVSLGKAEFGYCLAVFQLRPSTLLSTDDSG